ncbi:MarR family transcriptional regulator [Clavibacter michiganensis]|uniref:MarR family transcriptional regulator n=1 Tax=Clavibacter michiganensis TaxID=28447 RepID=UPI003DA11A2E
MSVHVRLASAASTLVDRMDEDTSEAWDSLTGLQVLLVRIIASGDRVDRVSLAAVARTARAATVPSLHSLIRKGMIAEVEDGDGTRLVLAEVGRSMLDDVQRARATWLRQAAEDAEPPVREADLARAASLLEHVGASPATGGDPAS